MNRPTLLMTPLRSALLAGHDNVLEVLIRVQAPVSTDAVHRPRGPLNLSLVIDRSGSMSGRPLAEAKRCAEFVIDQLTPRDTVSVVAYGDQVETLVEARPLDERERVRRAIRAISEGGSTDLYGGWRRGADTLGPLASPHAMSRVMLLSDGCANRGVTDLHEIAAQCRALAERGVTTSTYGLGRDFNESLMIAMAEAGGGNSYYGQTAEDLMDPFREEFALLNALFARKLELRLELAGGGSLEMLNAYPAAGASVWRLPDLAFGAEAWAVVRLRVPRDLVERLALAPDRPLLQATLRCVDVEGRGRDEPVTDLVLPVLPGVAFGAVAENPLVRRRVEELEAARTQRTARRAALAGDWTTVEQLLAGLEPLGKDNAWIRDIARELRQLAKGRDRALFAKETSYQSRRMSSRLASHDELDLSLDAPVPDFLRRKAAQGKQQPGSSDEKR